MEQTEPIRVLVADDSAFMRKMITDILRKHDMEVLAAAHDGVDALEKTRQLRPDVITLDVEMPRMDGVTFLQTLMQEMPTPVVMLSSLTGEGADTTIRCLELGAVDCLKKPSGSISLDIDKIADEIVNKVRSAAKANRNQLRPRPHRPLPAARPVSPPPAAPRGAASPAAPAPSGKPFGSQDALIVIASSTGGPGALQQVVPHIPGDIPAGVLIVQHLPIGFTKSLAQRLDASSALTVREAVEGEPIQRGVALVAPAGRHMAIDAKGLVRLNDEPPLWGVRPAADVTLRTAAEHFGARMVVAVLTGMGRDGALGAKAARGHGAVCFGQNEETCVVYGMPRAAYECGGIDKELPIGEIARAIDNAVRARGVEKKAANF